MDNATSFLNLYKALKPDSSAGTQDASKTPNLTGTGSPFDYPPTSPYPQGTSPDSVSPALTSDFSGNLMSGGIGMGRQKGAPQDPTPSTVHGMPGSGGGGGGLMKAATLGLAAKGAGLISKF
jgi:hypothetical protein